MASDMENGGRHWLRTLGWWAFVALVIYLIGSWIINDGQTLRHLLDQAGTWIGHVVQSAASVVAGFVSDQLHKLPTSS